MIVQNFHQQVQAVLQRHQILNGQMKWQIRFLSGLHHWKIKLKILQELLIQNLILYCKNFNKWFWQKNPTVLRDHEQKHIFHLGFFLTNKCNMEIMIEKTFFKNFAKLSWDISRRNSRVNESRTRPPRTKTAVRPCGQRTKIWAQTVHLMDRFGRETQILILRWTSGRIFYHGPSTSWTDSDAFL